MRDLAGGPPNKNLGEALERFLLTKGSCLRQVTLAPIADGSQAAPPVNTRLRWALPHSR